jgi:hypothetical protein
MFSSLSQVQSIGTYPHASTAPGGRVAPFPSIFPPLVEATALSVSDLVASRFSILRRRLPRPAHRQGANTPAQQGLRFAHKAVAAQRPACLRPKPNPDRFLLGQTLRMTLEPSDVAPQGQGRRCRSVTSHYPLACLWPNAKNPRGLGTEPPAPRMSLAYRITRSCSEWPCCASRVNAPSTDVLYRARLSPSYHCPDLFNCSTKSSVNEFTPYLIPSFTISTYPFSCASNASWVRMLVMNSVRMARRSSSGALV